MIRIQNKIFIGPQHSWVITNDGSLYTFGAGKYGVLGHGDDNDVSSRSAKKIEFFKYNNIKIKDCKLGLYHSIDLTETGDVYTWGYGGATSFFTKFFNNTAINALGHGNSESYSIPKRIEFFDSIDSKIIQIACGLYHWLALTDKGDVYNWGCGEHGNLALDNPNDQVLEPKLNQNLSFLK